MNTDKKTKTIVSLFSSVFISVYLWLEMDSSKLPQRAVSQQDRICRSWN